jgi:hypothetical protein
MNPGETMRGVIQWLRSPADQPNTRGMNLLLVFGVIASCAGALVSTAHQDNALAAQTEERAYDICVQRVDGRADIRSVFIDFYDFIEDLRGPSAEVTELREHLDELLPPLDVQSVCGEDPTL